MKNLLNKQCLICNSTEKSKKGIKLNAIICNNCGWEFIIYQNSFDGLIEKAKEKYKKTNTVYVKSEIQISKLEKELNQDKQKLKRLEKYIEKYGTNSGKLDFYSTKEKLDELKSSYNYLNSLEQKDIVIDNTVIRYKIKDLKAENKIQVEIYDNKLVNQQWKLAILYANKFITNVSDAEITEIIKFNLRNFTPKYINGGTIFTINHSFLPKYKFTFFRKFNY